MTGLVCDVSIVYEALVKKFDFFKNRISLMPSRVHDFSIWNKTRVKKAKLVYYFLRFALELSETPASSKLAISFKNRTADLING